MSTTIIEKLLSAGQTLTGSVYRALAAKGLDGNTSPLLVDQTGNLKTVIPTDVFGRVPVAEPIALYTLSQVKQAFADLYTVSDTVSGGTVTYNGDRVCRVLSTNTGNSSRATFQSREYVPYQPGRQQQTIITGYMGTDVTNNVKEMGLFDNDNGIFLERDGSSWSLVIRSKTTGSVVDTKVTQANWSVDKLDGTGVSGITLTTSEFTVMVIEFGWLGGAGARVGFVRNTTIYWAHVFTTGTNTAPFIQIPSLPVRWQIRNKAPTASAASFDATCAAVYSFGASDVGNAIISHVTTTAQSTSTTFLPIVSVRLKSGFERGYLDNLSFSVLTTDNVSLIAKVMVRNSLTGTPSWSATTGPATEYDESASGISGGIQVASALLERSGSRSISGVVRSPIRVASDFSGTADILTLAVRTVSGNGNVYGALTWREV